MSHLPKRSAGPEDMLAALAFLVGRMEGRAARVPTEDLSGAQPFLFARFDLRDDGGIDLVIEAGPQTPIGVPS